MTPAATRNYLLFQAKRRLVPTLNNIAGMAAVEKHLVARQRKPLVLAEPHLWQRAQADGGRLGSTRPRPFDRTLPRRARLRPLHV